MGCGDRRKIDRINYMIMLTKITLSSFHCIILIWSKSDVDINVSLSVVSLKILCLCVFDFLKKCLSLLYCFFVSFNKSEFVCVSLLYCFFVLVKTVSVCVWGCVLHSVYKSCVWFVCLSLSLLCVYVHVIECAHELCVCVDLLVSKPMQMNPCMFVC